MQLIRCALRGTWCILARKHEHSPPVHVQGSRVLALALAFVSLELFVSIRIQLATCSQEQSKYPVHALRPFCKYYYSLCYSSSRGTCRHGASGTGCRARHGTDVPLRKQALERYGYRSTTQRSALLKALIEVAPVRPLAAVPVPVLKHATAKATRL